MRGGRLFRWIFVWALGLVCCGESEEMAPPPPEFPTSSDAAWEPGPQTDVPESTTIGLPSPGEIRSVRAAAGEVYVGASTGLYRVDQSVLALVPVYLEEEGEPTSTGAVVDMEVFGDVLVVAAENGLYHVQDWALLRSPMNDVVSDLQIHALSLADDAVWIGAEEGLFRITDDVMESLSLGLGGAVVDVAAIPGATVLTYGTGHFGEALSYVFDTVTMESDWLPGGVTAGQMAGWQEHLVVASGDLMVRVPDAHWIRWTELQVASMGVGGEGLFLATDDGIYRLTSDEDGPGVTPVANVGDLSATVGVTMDAWGHLWTATPDGLTRWETGSPLTFDDVRGIFSGQCAWCHATGLNAPKRDFESYEVVFAMLEPITEWIALDLMPPAGMGGPVSDENKLLLQQWIDQGASP